MQQQIVQRKVHVQQENIRLLIQYITVQQVVVQHVVVEHIVLQEQVVVQVVQVDIQVQLEQQQKTNVILV